MKPILNITEKEFKVLPTTISRTERMVKDYSIGLFDSLVEYDKDWSELNGLMATSGIYDNLLYVDHLFIVISYLHRYYEFSPHFFDLLGLAANNIERLYNKEIQELMSNPEAITELRTEVATSLEKITLIFQIATDTTEDKERAFSYTFNAKQYSEKANIYAAVGQKSYTATIQRLYQKYSKDEFIGTFLKPLADKYQIKFEEEMSRSAPRSASSSFSSGTSSIPASPQFFAPVAPPTAYEAQPLLTRRNVGSDKFALNS